MRKDSVSTAAKGSRSLSRRHFLGQGGGVAATLAVGALAAPDAASAESLGGNDIRVAAPPGPNSPRLMQAFNLRVREATEDLLAGAAPNFGNGDDALYPDMGGTFTKGLPHDSFGRVDLNAYRAF